MNARKLIEAALASAALLSIAGTGAVASGCGKSKSSATGSGGSPSATTTPTATPSEIPQGDGGGPPVVTPGKGCTGATASTFTAQTNVPAPPAVTVPAGFKIEVLAAIDAARHIVALPNGDLLVATQGDTIYIVPGAESDGPSGAPKTFAIMPERPAHGVAFAPESCTIYVAGPQGIYSLPYSDGATQATPTAPIAKVRPNGVNGHITTSVAFTANTLFASVGSSCNACVETDPTRATVQTLGPDGSNMATKAKRIRNAIALTVNGETGAVWAGGAGQDDLPPGHPYEFLDPISLHPGVLDYGWPDCEENHVAYKQGADCSNVIVPRVVVPAYATLMSAVFYPTNQTGSFAFPASWRGLFLSAHGSWHVENGKYVSLPRVTFTAMQGDDPKTPVDWNDPNKQHAEFISGFQLEDGNTRVGRPSGMAVGPRGTLFVADDHRGMVYRVRPQ